jgi:sugar O-acyltransferase (sialic acid O-acetyltransferase NeuD family)
VLLNKVAKEVDMRLFMIGAKAQARMIHNILTKDGHTVPYVYDQDRDAVAPWACELIHDEDQIEGYARKCEGFVVCVGDVERGETRVRLSKQLEGYGLSPVSALHSTMHVGDQVRIGKGLQAIAHAVINDFTTIGDYCILGINCALDHDCRLGDGVHVMGGAAVAGEVVMGNYATVGANSTILPHLSIGERAIVGAGAVVTRDVPAKAVVIGAPARVLRILD